MQDKITKEKLEKYFLISGKALKIAEKNINAKRKKEAEEILKMAGCYLSDAKYFQSKKDFVNAFAAVNYAHGWLDTGARLGIFKVKDDKLFVVK
ncbi:MAG: DUF357 domain-containing protein [Nanoarchaeota archaeon]|nr:DUF357 domain-containing protein [Nanoarchaeota archaeon]